MQKFIWARHLFCRPHQLFLIAARRVIPRDYFLWESGERETTENNSFVRAVASRGALLRRFYLRFRGPLLILFRSHSIVLLHCFTPLSLIFQCQNFLRVGDFQWIFSAWRTQEKSSWETLCVAQITLDVWYWFVETILNTFGMKECDFYGSSDCAHTYPHE